MITLKDTLKFFYPSDLFKKYLSLSCPLTQEKHHFLINVINKCNRTHQILKEERKAVKIILQ